jgi:hypothetical protein
MSKQSRTSGPRHLRGYRLIVYRHCDYGPAEHYMLWDVNIPPLWMVLQDDITITQAFLYRSGRRFKSYRKEIHL